MPCRLQTAVLTTFVALYFAAHAFAQTEISVEPATGRLGWITRPYRARNVPAIRLTNSPRMEALLRAGNLYLTAPDVVALAIENNIDVEVQRYGPLLAQEVLRRAQGGGALRSVGAAVAAGPQSVSLEGVSVNNSGSVALSSGSGVSSGGGIVTQLGPNIPSLDPSLFAFASFQHASIPQSNTFLTGTDALIQDTRSFQAQYSQTFDFGLTAQLTFANSHFHVNSNLFSLNPYTSGDLDLQITQNLLQGFGRAVNGRNIRVQRNNVKVSDLQFKQQVITTVSAALNLYWDLVSFEEDLRARREEVSTAQQLLDDNKRQVQIGALAEIEITRAEAQLYSSQQDLVISQTNLQQQEIILKNALCRNGISAAGLENIRIVPLDRIEVPASDETRPLEDLTKLALVNRGEIAQARLNIESNEMNLVGIKNSLKPTLQAFAELTNNALSGELTALGAEQPGVTYLAGGYGNLLAQIARRNFPNYSAGFSLEHTAAQSGGSIRLRHQPAGASPEPAQFAQEHEPGDGRRAKRRDRVAAGARALYGGEQVARTAAADSGGRSTTLRAGFDDGLPSCPGPARFDQQPEQRDAGHGQLHACPHHAGPGVGDYVGCESCFAG